MMKEYDIWFAAGCFWGAQKFFKLVDGVIFTEVGFANGYTVDPTYKKVYTDTTGHAECVHVRYDAEKVPLRVLVELFLKIVDPFSINRQGEDEGTRYRTGIYYEDSERDLPEIEKVIRPFEEKEGKRVAVEIEPLHCFYRAEDYHQDYLDKNPGGYCHLSPEIFKLAKQLKNMGKSLVKLLCVIDMQNDFISGSLGTEEAEAVVPAVVEKIANWDGPTIATRDTHFEQTYLSTQEGRYLPVKHCIRGTQGWEIEPRVAEALKNSRCIGIVDKEHFAEAPQAQSSSRTLADFVQSLKSDGSSLEITLIGVCTDICVVSNALMLKSMFPENHFTVDSSCCAGTTPDNHDSALKVLRSCQIDVI